VVGSAAIGFALFLWAGNFIDSLSCGALGSLLSAWALWVVGAAAARDARLDDALHRAARSFLPLLVFYSCPVLYIAPWLRAFSAAAAIMAVALWLAFHYALTPKRSRSVDRRKPRALPAALFVVMALYAACFATMNVLQYLSFNVCFSDTGVLTEVMWNTLHGRPWHTNALASAPGSVANYDHVALILFFLMPLFWALPSALTLMIAQTLWLAGGAVPTYQIARNAFSKVGLPDVTKRRLALAFAAAYLLHPATQTANIDAGYNAFRPVVWAVPFLLWSIWFAERRRVAGLCICLALALCCGEEIAVIVAAFGVYLMLAKRWRTLGASIALVSIAWLLASVCVVIPSLRGAQPLYLGNYARFGETPGEIGLHLLTHPLAVLRTLADGAKLEYVMHLLIPFALLSLAKPSLLAVTVPVLAYNLLSAREAQFDVSFYYAAPMIPFVVAAAARGGAKAAGAPWLSRGLRRWSGVEMSRTRAARCLTCVLVVCGALSTLFYGISPVSLNFFAHPRYGPQVYAVAARDRLARATGNRIPSDASLCSTNFLGTPYACRKDFFLFPDGYRQADYVFLDLDERWLDAREVSEAVQWLKGSANQIVERDGLLLFERITPGGKMPRVVE